MGLIRLDKYLADQGIGTRSIIKQYIKKGRVQLEDGSKPLPETKIDPTKMAVFFDGNIVRPVGPKYFVMHKPAGVVCATKDNHDKTVLDSIKPEERKDLFPIGRLDKDTEGLLILTDDGITAHELLSPRKHVEKTYYVEVTGLVNDDDIASFQEGLSIGDEKPTMPAKLQIIKASSEKSQVIVKIKEGRFHQIKRMFHAVGKEVLYLKRIAMGNYSLPADLEKGSYRKMTAHEIETLKGRTNFCDTDM